MVIGVLSADYGKEISGKRHSTHFTIIKRAHPDYHLKILESLYIKSRQFSLCKKKGWLLGLNLIVAWLYILLLFRWFPSSRYYFLNVVHTRICLSSIGLEERRSRPVSLFYLFIFLYCLVYCCICFLVQRYGVLFYYHCPIFHLFVMFLFLI